MYSPLLFYGETQSDVMASYSYCFTNSSLFICSDNSPFSLGNSLHPELNLLMTTINLLKGPDVDPLSLSLVASSGAFRPYVGPCNYVMQYIINGSEHRQNVFAILWPMKWLFQSEWRKSFNNNQAWNMHAIWTCTLWYNPWLAHTLKTFSLCFWNRFFFFLQLLEQSSVSSGFSMLQP